MKEENKDGWFQLKGYLHFSPKITKEDYNWVKNFIAQKEKIANYAFYPLIHRSIIQRRYKKLIDNNGNILTDSNEKPIRSHYDHIKKKSTAKVRHIYYANHLDALIYGYYTKEILEPLYENELKTNTSLSSCISAYRAIKVNSKSRAGKSNIHFANDVFCCIKKLDECVALTFDIEQFFDSLNHIHLKKAWCKLLQEKELPKWHYNIYKSLTNFSFVEETDLLDELNLLKLKGRFELKKIINQKNIKSYCNNNKEFRERICGKNNKKKKSLVKPHPFEYKKNELHYPEHLFYKKRKLKGIPQGTAISAFLANLYLLEFDKSVLNEVTSLCGGIYRRYSDDIVVICKKEHEERLKSFLVNEINKYQLTINSDKCEASYFKRNLNNVLVLDTNSKPLRYLGFEFNGSEVRLKSSSIAKYYRRMKRLIKFKALRASFLKKKNTTIHTQIHKKKIYKRYSHLGNRNFLSYGYKSANTINENEIKSQLKRHWRNLNKYLSYYENKFKLPKWGFKFNEE